jgi:hypothetical protein
MKSRIKQSLTFVIGWPFSFVAIFFICKTFLPKFDQISHNLQSVNYSLLFIGVCSFILYYFTRSIGLSETQASHSIRFSLGQSTDMQDVEAVSKAVKKVFGTIHKK